MGGVFKKVGVLMKYKYIDALIKRWGHCLKNFHRPVNGYDAIADKKGRRGIVKTHISIECECGKVFWRKS